MKVEPEIAVMQDPVRLYWKKLDISIPWPRGVTKSGRCGYMYQAARVSASLTQESAAEAAWGWRCGRWRTMRAAGPRRSRRRYALWWSCPDAPALKRHPARLHTLPFLRQYLPEGRVYRYRVRRSG